MTNANSSFMSRFCSVCARCAGIDPVGHAGPAYETVIAIERPLPWSANIFGDPIHTPPELMSLMQSIRDDYAQHGLLRTAVLALAPDTEYSVPGLLRIMCYRRPEAPFTVFDQEEYLVPKDMAGPLVWALARDREQLEDFAPYRQQPESARDILVCTHGSVDAACSKFGYPTYKMLRDQHAHESNGKLRVWRTSHFGGHVFAPTLIDMPHGSLWGYIYCNEADILARRTSDIARLRNCYRGWSGLAGSFLQTAERELLLRYGWEWLDYQKHGFVLHEGPQSPPNKYGMCEPTWAEVQIDYVTPEGEQGSHVARVEMAGCVDTIHTSGQEDTYPYSQYVVTKLERLLEVGAV